MPTPNEKKALAFLSAFALLGAGVRVTQAVTRASTADAASREALRRQIVAAESASAAGRRPKRSVVTRRERPKPVTALDSAMTAPAFSLRSYYDTPAPAAATTKRKGKGSAPPPSAPVDVDRASATELEALPRIGPALAKRIVDDREANGPFGSIEGLQRVKGVGPAMARTLAPNVTFSGTPRPSIAGRGGRDRTTGRAPDSWRHPAPP